MGITVTLIDGITEGNGYDLMSLANDIFKKDNFVLGPSDLKVTEQSPLGLGVTVAAGTCYMYIGTVPTFYRLVVEEEDLSIDGNSSGSTRYDLVCVKFDTSVTVNSDASNVGTLEIVKGTPGGGVPSTPANHFKLAEVEVVNSAASIVDAKITDTRNFPIFSPSIHPIKDGWQGLPTTTEPTQGSATTITAPSNIDWTDYFEVGDSVKWNGGKAYVTVVTAVTLTVVGDSVPATITNFKYSKIPGKAGFIGWTPTYTPGGSMTYTSVTIYFAKFAMFGKLLKIHHNSRGTIGGTASNYIDVNLPATLAATLPGNPVSTAGYIYDSGSHAIQIIPSLSPSISALRCYKLDGSNFGLGGAKDIRILDLSIPLD